MINKVGPLSIKVPVSLKMGSAIEPSSFKAQVGIQGLESYLC